MIAATSEVLAQQRTYRALMDAFARPGTIHAAPRTAIATTLLDHDTTFAVVGDDAEAEALTLRRLTNARLAPLERAAFVFVTGGDPTLALHAASNGTLEAPHEGATVLIAVADVTAGAEFLIAGPGVAGEGRMRVAARFDWWTPRAERVREFPLGIDLLLHDARGRFVALPRSTRLRPVWEA